MWVELSNFFFTVVLEFDCSLLPLSVSRGQDKYMLQSWKTEIVGYLLHFPPRTASDGRNPSILNLCLFHS